VAAPYPPGYTAGDDFSFVIADHKYIRVAWGDSRNAFTQVIHGGVPETYNEDGGVQMWMARIPLASFEHGRG
jgi:hypothetical protein